MNDSNDKLMVLFLCTGNSCRSQMAEGWAKHLKNDLIEPFSAGVRPSRVSQRAITVMTEKGVDISNHRSKHVDEFSQVPFDYVVTVCDHAREACPVFPGKTKMIHKSFPDPAGLIGNDEKVMNSFRKVRDQIREFIETMPESLEKLYKQQQGD